VYSFDILMHAQSLTYVTRSRYKSFHRFAAAAALIQLACFNTYDYGLVYFPCEPKIFHLSPITSNLSTHA
jgi:hypothetical protein